MPDPGAQPVTDLRIPAGPGFPDASRANGHHVLGPATVPADSGPAPGAALINWAAWLLALIGGGALYVSFDAQYQVVFTARHQDVASIVEALLLDLLMITFTLLALGLSRAGKSSRTERALILACAAASAWMNVADADTASPRSIAAYAVAPVALAVVVDRVVAVIRRHVQASEEPSAWTVLARTLAAAARLTGTILLYTARFALAPPSTASGLRRRLLAAAPLPEIAAPAPDKLPRCLVPVASTPGALCWAALPCARHPPPAVHSPAAPPAINPGTGPATLSAEPATLSLPGLQDPRQAAGPQPPAEPPPAPAASHDGKTPGPGTRPGEAPAAQNGRQRSRASPVTYENVRDHFAADIAAGRPPSGKAIRRQFGLGSDRAGEYAGRLAAAAQTG